MKRGRFECDDVNLRDDVNILESMAAVRAVRRGDKLIGRIMEEVVWGSSIWGRRSRNPQLQCFAARGSPDLTCAFSAAPQVCSLTA